MLANVTKLGYTLCSYYAHSKKVRRQQQAAVSHASSIVKHCMKRLLHWRLVFHFASSEGDTFFLSYPFKPLWSYHPASQTMLTYVGVAQHYIPPNMLLHVMD